MYFYTYFQTHILNISEVKKKKNINYTVGWNNIALNMFWNQIFSFNLYVLAICMEMNASHPMQTKKPARFHLEYCFIMEHIALLE